MLHIKNITFFDFLTKKREYDIVTLSFLVILTIFLIYSLFLWTIFHEIGHYIIWNYLLGLNGHIEFNFSALSQNIFNLDVTKSIPLGHYYFYITPDIINQNPIKVKLLYYFGAIFESLGIIVLYLVSMCLLRYKIKLNKWDLRIIWIGLGIFLLFYILNTLYLNLTIIEWVINDKRLFLEMLK